MARWTTPKCRNIAVKSLRGWYGMMGVYCAQKLKATSVLVLPQAKVSNKKTMIFIAMIEYVIIDSLMMFFGIISFVRNKVLFMIKISVR